MAPGDDDGEDALDHDAFDDDGDEHEVQTSVTVDVNGLSLYTHHGVTAAEREVGQRLILDIRLELGEADATVSAKGTLWLLPTTTSFVPLPRLVLPTQSPLFSPA